MFGVSKIKGMCRCWKYCFLCVMVGCTDYATQIEDMYGEQFRSKNDVYSAPAFSSSSGYVIKTASSSSYKNVTRAACGGTTYDPATEFCDESNGYGIVETYCHTTCYSPDYSKCSSCMQGTFCGGIPYNSKYFVCVSGELRMKCDAGYFGHDFYVRRKPCVGG